MIHNHSTLKFLSKDEVEAIHEHSSISPGCLIMFIVLINNLKVTGHIEYVNEFKYMYLTIINKRIECKSHPSKQVNTQHVSTY